MQSGRQNLRYNDTTCSIYSIQHFAISFWIYVSTLYFFAFFFTVRQTLYRWYSNDSKRTMLTNSILRRRTYTHSNKCTHDRPTYRQDQFLVWYWQTDRQTGRISSGSVPSVVQTDRQTDRIRYYSVVQTDRQDQILVCMVTLLASYFWHRKTLGNIYIKVILTSELKGAHIKLC